MKWVLILIFTSTSAVVFAENDSSADESSPGMFTTVRTSSFSDREQPDTCYEMTTLPRSKNLFGNFGILKPGTNDQEGSGNDSTK